MKLNCLPIMNIAPGGGVTGSGTAIPYFQAGAPVGNLLPDNSGEGNDVSIFNTCLYFDNSGYIDYGASTAQISGAMTIAAYMMGKSDNASHCGFGRGDISGSYDYMLGISNAGQLKFQIAVDATTVRTVTYELPNYDTVRHHIIGVYSPSTYIRLYVDGVQVAENTTSIPASQYTHVTNPFTIGQSSLGTSDFVGEIFDVKVYSAIKTYAQVIANNTTDIEFWDLMNSFANTMAVFGRPDGYTYAITGQRGTKEDFYFEFNTQNLARHNLGYTRVNYDFPVVGGEYEVFIPYDINGVSQYAAYGPIWDAGETVVEVPYNVNAKVHNWPDKYVFPDALSAYDVLGYLTSQDGTGRVLDYDRMASNVGDYYVVETDTNVITSLTIYDGSETYDDIEFFVLWGQSNMVGVGTGSPLETGDLNTYIYTEAGMDFMNWTENTNQYSEKTTQFGMEINLSERLYALRGVVNVFCKMAYGGISLSENGGWLQPGMYNHYNVLEKSVGLALYWTARDLGKKPVIKGIIQHQGESDANQEDDSLAFAANLTAFYARFEAYLGGSFDKFICRVADLDHPWIDNVKAQTDIYVAANADAYVLDCAAFELSGDDTHHTAAGYNAMGIAMANLIDATI